ncbi:hypothetical protein PENANT_c024G05074 [Penicillium antarcticum]|uniref:Phosphoglycerate mutase n=1 Tax=Penicillium antarcticum TaxID=416450 RepID=A0A1V6PY40_9EURO|nr:uncharacterized protein N7508_005099 [Penicillium antarcticum]KAJ5306084.1 hypothetical protein N7508_005099 [Penicillium antarcticum]OQD81930.1 hypothetical protein PENANT_c024G05074 [Penicillium antarcticum]
MTESKYSYSIVPGYFLQDDPATDPATFDYVKSDFGLIAKSYDTEKETLQTTQWQRFSEHIKTLNSNPHQKYKVLFLGRHGEGVHNVAETRYGTKAWDEHWSLLDGDEYGSWVDAHLTEKGIDQAKTAHAAWEEQIEKGVPAPQSYYVSPLNRCLATAQVTFAGLPMSGTEPFKPIVKELLRETMGEHTCDKRSTASAIKCEYPEYIIEQGFTEADELWDAKTRESDQDRDARLRRFLDDVFDTDENVFVSMTAHSGAISSILQVAGHRWFPLATGGVIPVVVVAEKETTQLTPAATPARDPEMMRTSMATLMALLERADGDGRLSRLMSAVSGGRATREEMEEFTAIVNKQAFPSEGK